MDIFRARKKYFVFCVMCLTKNKTKENYHKFDVQHIDKLVVAFTVLA